jgi:predicted N-acetyltransferase YhbS
VIVDTSERGRGLGRQLMDGALSLATDRSLRLIATESGLPLYEKLGFQKGSAVVQHQGCVAQPVADTAGIRPARPDDLAAITALDREAYGADRSHLLSHLAHVARLAVLERAGRVSGFSALRRFGHGEVIGPVVAADIDDAKALMSHFLSSRIGAFVRIDTDASTKLGPWLADIGLVYVGGGIAMSRPPRTASKYRSIATFALASQAFG